MSLLGCNSKILWNDIFLQIVDIISVKTEKVGFIICKNFHMIHGELLEIFYSYIQQYSECYNNKLLFGGNILIHFIIITENVSFLPNNILQSCHILNIGRPSYDQYNKMITLTNNSDLRPSVLEPKTQSLTPLSSSNDTKITENMLNNIMCDEIINIKELYSFKYIDNKKDIPKDIFNIVCDNILKEILNHKKMSFSNFRDVIYDILIYNLEAVDCIWYILFYLINYNSDTKESSLSKKNPKSSKMIGYLTNKDISDILNKVYFFLKYYNNNYRPIYHLESILFYIIVKLYHYELPKSYSDNGIGK
jgi:hypothetical protein